MREKKKKLFQKLLPLQPPTTKIKSPNPITIEEQMKLKRAKEENSYSKEYVEILFSAIFCTEFFAIECIVEPGLVCGAED